MRTTVRLNEALLQEARHEAAKRGTTLTALIEEGLRLALLTPVARGRAFIELPVSSAAGGLLPGIDLDDSASLLDRLDSP